jgi:hypothetical protein
MSYKVSSIISSTPVNLVMAKVESQSGDAYRQLSTIKSYFTLVKDLIPATTETFLNLASIDFSFAIQSINVNGIGSNQNASDIIFNTYSSTGSALAKLLFSAFSTDSIQSLVDKPLIVEPGYRLSVTSDYAINRLILTVIPVTNTTIIV